MKITAKHVCVGLLVVVLASCGTSWKRFEQELESERQKALDSIDIQDCKRRGGEVRGVCMFGIPACVTPYADAGIACRDSSQCAGQCLYDGDDAGVGTNATGVCQENDDPCGCFTEVWAGRITTTICSD